MSAAPRRVVLASHNSDKLTELTRILAGYDVRTLTPPGLPEVVETGATYAENALLKARAAARASGRVAVADDSGLAVDALAGMPGVLSARWAGRHGDDAANLALLLGQLADVPDERRGAAFVCAAAAVAPDGRERLVEARMPGRLTRQPRGSGGFGYDPVFVPHGHARTSAELDPAVKDALSHRGQALRALAPLLADLL